MVRTAILGVLVGAAEVWACEATQSATLRVTARQFPNYLGFLYSDGVAKEDDSPGCGVYVAYRDVRTDMLVCSLIVYDGGRRDIGTGATRAALDAYRGALAEVRRAYPKFGQLREARTQLKAPREVIQALAAQFAFEVEGAMRDSWLFLTGFRGQFLKVRCSTTPKAPKREALRSYQAFIADLGSKLDEIFPSVFLPEGGKESTKGEASKQGGMGR